MANNENYRTVNIAVPVELHAKLRDAAKRSHRSMSNLCVAVISEYLETEGRPSVNWQPSPQSQIRHTMAFPQYPNSFHLTDLLKNKKEESE
jgi:hypothetical protein